MIVEVALLVKIAYYEWALDNMRLDHPDAPEVIERLYHLNDQLENHYERA